MLLFVVIPVFNQAETLGMTVVRVGEAWRGTEAEQMPAARQSA
jgi:hypothetical protein